MSRRDFVARGIRCRSMAGTESAWAAHRVDVAAAARKVAKQLEAALALLRSGYDGNAAKISQRLSKRTHAITDMQKARSGCIPDILCLSILTDRERTERYFAQRITSCATGVILLDLDASRALLSARLCLVAFIVAVPERDAGRKPASWGFVFVAAAACAAANLALAVMLFVLEFVTPFLAEATAACRRLSGCIQVRTLEQRMRLRVWPRPFGRLGVSFCQCTLELGYTCVKLLRVGQDQAATFAADHRERWTELSAA